MIANTRFEILTPTGFQDFAGVRITKGENTIAIMINGGILRCTPDHPVLTEHGVLEAQALKIGDLIQTDKGLSAVEGIETLVGDQLFYDPVEVHGGHLYISNGIVSHNCEFLSSEAMLISSMKLQQITGRPVHHEDMGFKFWVPPEELGGAGKTYLVSIDPATGNGKDFSVIEIFDFPALRQVAEWRSNDIDIPLLYAKVKWVLNKLSAQVGRGRAEVLWTFERNGIGEAMVALFNNDEKQPEFAELFSDMPGKFGVYTTGKTKIISCLQLKMLVEKVTNGLKINSETLIFELKNFIAKGGSYEGKAGATDDCVMATVGITRLIKRLAEYNDDAFKQVNEYVDPDDVSEDGFGDEPVPFAIV